MKNNVNPENKSSVWWWTQWLLTGLVVCVLSYFLYSFVMAATENVCITDVTCLSPDNGVKNTKRISASIYGVSSNRQTDDAAFKLKTLVVDAGKHRKDTTVHLSASFSQEYSSLSRHIRRRLEWRMFEYDGNRWLNPEDVEQDKQISEYSKPSRLSIFKKPGNYLIVVSLPPAAPENLNGRSSDYIADFLSGSMTTKCGAFQVVVKGGDTPQVPSVEEADEEKLREEAKKEHGKEMKRGLSADREKKEGEELTKTDISTTKADGQRGLNNTSRLVKKVPLTKSARILLENEEMREKAEKKEIKQLRREGNLPIIEYFYEEKEFRQLTLNQWKDICRQYNMPFVAVPEDSFKKEFTVWPVLWMDGTRRDMTSKEIESELGFQKINLEDLRPEIHSYIKKQMDDPEVWDKCSLHRGFLLSDSLVDAVRLALKQENLTVNKVKDIYKIEVHFEIDSHKEGRPKMQIRNIKVEIKEAP